MAETKFTPGYVGSRDPARIDPILMCFSMLWHANPDMRFGQLADYVTHDHLMGSGFSTEDYETLGRIAKALGERATTNE